MRRFYLTILLSALLTTAYSQPQANKYAYDLAYFLPKGNYSYNANIPKPETVLGFQIGQQHADYGMVVDYMKTLATASDRVTVRETMRTYQFRPFIEVVITSAENQKNIEAIKAQHLALTEVSKSGSLPINDMPVVISLIYSIHGNEASGVNASLAVAYFFAAAQGKDMDELLKNTIIVITPGANPDGINRFASWVNSSRSQTNVSDTNSREFTEPWPSSRTNHYWADCNRDWLMLQHPEGVNGVENYFEWMPNVVVDQHEQGALRPYYFSPGHPKRTHPLTPQQNQDLTAAITAQTAAALDEIGTAYYSKEGYDDFYLGKGAAYGDIHGSVCILYEQGSTRGHLRKTPSGVWAFPWTIRNQSLASIATVHTTCSLRRQLLDYQKSYFEKSANNAKKETVQGYVFDTRSSKSIAYYFLDNLAHHRIDVYHLAKDMSINGKKFSAKDAYVIPVAQKNSAMVKTLMENMTEFADSTFYDISTWTFAHAFNLNYAPVGQIAGLKGQLVTENKFPEGHVIGAKSNYAYVIDPTEYYAPKVIYELQRKGIFMSANSSPFKFHAGDVNKSFCCGAVLVMVQNQPVSADELYAMLTALTKETGVDVYAATTGLMEDVDFASPAYTCITQPKVAMLVGRSMSTPESGEVWFMLDRRFQMQPVLIEKTTLTLKDYLDYNVIILANGTPTLTKSSEDALKEWVGMGGTLIATGKAASWVKQCGLLALKTKSTTMKTDSTAFYAYADRNKRTVGNSIDGVILNCKLDQTHPLAWGFDQAFIPVMKNDNVILGKYAKPYASPLYYTDKPVLSGFISAKNTKLLEQTPAVIADGYKSGRVIVFANDMNFRSYWFATSKIFMNAIFYRECI